MGDGLREHGVLGGRLVTVRGGLREHDKFRGRRQQDSYVGGCVIQGSSGIIRRIMNGE